MAAPRVTAWSRFGAYLGEVTPISEFVHKAKINGTDSITVSTATDSPATKGAYLLWADDEGTWHEHVVINLEYSHRDARTLTLYAVSSISELAQDYVVDIRPGVQVPCPASTALASLLQGTRWGVGSVDVAGTNGASIYHADAWEGLKEIVDVWGGEVASELTVDPAAGVTARRVALRDHLGHAAPQRRLTFGVDLAGVVRTVEDESPITACYAWGKGEQLESGGYGRRIGIASVTPDGLPYVHDDSLLPVWGIPGPGGAIVHRFGEVVDGNCEDPAKLMAIAQDYLEAHSSPVVSYEGTLASFERAGANLEGLHLGDEVQVVDDGIGVRTQARVVALDRDYVQPTRTKVTLGNFLGTVADEFAKLTADVSGLLSKSSGWDVVADAGPSYVDAVVDSLNAMFAQAGGFVTIDDVTGITVMDAADFDHATKAIQINGAGFRIANSKSGTDWVWRTFGTGAGFTADEIIAGTIRGGNSFWNLETGELSLGGYATSSQVAAAQTAADNAVSTASSASSTANAASSTATNALGVANAASAAATDAAKVATNYIGIDANRGITVGDMSAGTLGSNVFIDADSVDVRDGSATLASFGANIVALLSDTMEMSVYHQTSPTVVDSASISVGDFSTNASLSLIASGPSGNAMVQLDPENQIYVTLPGSGSSGSNTLTLGKTVVSVSKPDAWRDAIGLRTYGSITKMSATQTLTTSSAKVTLSTFSGVGCSASGGGISLGSGTYMLWGRVYLNSGYTANDLVHVEIFSGSTMVADTLHRVTIASANEVVQVGPVIATLSATAVVTVHAYNQTSARGTVTSRNGCGLFVRQIG